MRPFARNDVTRNHKSRPHALGMMRCHKLAFDSDQMQQLPFFSPSPQTSHLCFCTGANTNKREPVCKAAKGAQQHITHISEESKGGGGGGWRPAQRSKKVTLKQPKSSAQHSSNTMKISQLGGVARIAHWNPEIVQFLLLLL